MAQAKTPSRGSKKPDKTPTKAKVFSDAERAAIAERAREAKAEAAKADGESEIRVKIAEMQPRDRAMAERIHGVAKATAPVPASKTWSGVPACAKEGKIICFFQPAQKFKTRYATFGFNDPAHLDDGEMWPITFALMKVTATEEARIAALLKKAVS